MPTVSATELNNTYSVLTEDSFDYSSTGWTTSSRYFSYNYNNVSYKNTVVQSKIPSFIYKEDTIFADGHISFNLKADKAKDFGILFRRVDNLNYYVLNFDYNENKLRLLRKVNTGVENLVSTAKISLSNNKTYKVDIALLGKKIVVSVDDKEYITTIDEYLPEGHIGFSASKESAFIILRRLKLKICLIIFV